MLTKTILTRILAGAFQLVSLYATFFGITEILVANVVVAGILAVAINGGLLVCWHIYFSRTSSRESLPQAATRTEQAAEGTDDGFAERRLLALFAGMVLLAASVILSTVGMYTVVGYKTGSDTDIQSELSETMLSTKAIFEKVKGAVAANVQANRTDLNKKLSTASRKLASTRVESRNWPTRQAEVTRLTKELNTVDTAAEKLRTTQASSGGSEGTRERILAIQMQVSSMITEYGVDRNSILTPAEIRLLSFDTVVARNLYDQLWNDLVARRPLALISVVFGCLPDILAIAMVVLGVKRRKLWRSVREFKVWIVTLLEEIPAPAFPATELAFDVVVNDEESVPLLLTSVPLDPADEISESHIREFFPMIVGRLREHYGRRYEIRELPDNWRDVLQLGEPLELVAVAII